MRKKTDSKVDFSAVSELDILMFGWYDVGHITVEPSSIWFDNGRFV